jgi:hypothetical protein
MRNDVFVPTAFEATADGIDSGNQVVERNLSVRGTIAAGRAIQASGGVAAGASDLTGAGVAVPGANGESIRISSLTELVTIAAAASSTTVAFLLPANSIIRGVVGRVVVAIPTAATFTVGDATTAGRFATAVAVAINTTFVGTIQADQTGAPGPRQAAAAQIVITPNLTPGTAVGRVRLTVYFETYTPPTA